MRAGREARGGWIARPGFVGLLGLGLQACGGGDPAWTAAGHDPEAAPRAARPDAEGHRALENRWSFEGGAAITRASVGPVPVGREGRLAVELELVGAEGCEVRSFAWPPRRAGWQPVWRGRPFAAPADTRGASVRVAVRGGRARAELVLDRPWHPAAVSVELELWCGGRLRSVREGPRRELREAGGRRPDARAVIGVFPVARVPTELRVPRGTPTVDGQLDEAIWSGPGTSLVGSVDGEPVVDYPTPLRFAWDEHALYVAAAIPDADPWNEHRDRDAPLWEQEVFEVFVAGPPGAEDARDFPYLELQVAPSGAVFDARFTAYRRGDPAWDGEWTHALRLRGAPGPAGATVPGWTVELALPWAELCANTELSCPPRAGQRFRLNAFRIERPDRKRALGMALSPTLTTDFHAWNNAAVMTLADGAEAGP